LAKQKLSDEAVEDMAARQLFLAMRVAVMGIEEF